MNWELFLNYILLKLLSILHSIVKYNVIQWNDYENNFSENASAFWDRYPYNAQVNRCLYQQLVPALQARTCEQLISNSICIYLCTYMNKYPFLLCSLAHSHTHILVYASNVSVYKFMHNTHRRQSRLPWQWIPQNE